VELILAKKIQISHFDDIDPKMAQVFAHAKPYPHIVIDNFLAEKDAEKLLEEHKKQGDADQWGAYVHFNERKSGISKLDRMGPHTKAIITALSEPNFCHWLEELTGITGLLADPDLDGGGLHMIERGGFLNVHVDFLAHTTRRQWSRQLNLLLYLNKDWEEDWNGALELWDRDMTHAVEKIQPIFNRCVIFNTCEGSYHGHPTPLVCPKHVQRRSMALYYFRDEGVVQSIRSTHYVPTPEDGIGKRILIAADRAALRVYSFAKRYAGLRDGQIQKFLKKL
jgi:Rps23 Pro-64 3,4-dihydroxylase Tpa1-like proline 4-hydroxylase